MKFFFSDVFPKKFLPQYYTEKQIREHFNFLCRNYLQIVRENQGKIERGVVTTDTPTNIHIYASTLQDLLLSIPDRDLRQYMLSSFTKYPIESHVQQNILEKNILDTFAFQIYDISFDSIVVGIVRETGNLLLLLAFCPALDDPDFFKLPTLTHKNIDKFKNDLRTFFIDKSDDLEECIRYTSQKYGYTVNFQTPFIGQLKRLPQEWRNSIIDMFEKNMKFDRINHPDGKHIRHERDNVFVIKNKNPVIRIYFNKNGKNISIRNLLPGKHQKSLINRNIS